MGVFFFLIMIYFYDGGGGLEKRVVISIKEDIGVFCINKNILFVRFFLVIGLITFFFYKR